jgi:hypothetical protein
MTLESTYQSKVIKKITKMFPGCWAIKNNSAYLPGVPDWTIFYGGKWAMLEIKRKKPRPGTRDFRPNQEWYIAMFDSMSFCACLYPENEREVLRALQQTFGHGRAPRLPQPV